MSLTYNIMTGIYARLKKIIARGYEMQKVILMTLLCRKSSKDLKNLKAT